MSNLNSVLLSSAVSSLASALDSGVKAESAIVATVKAVAFMATDKIGAEMLAGEYDAKKSKAYRDVWTMVQKRLINQGKRIYRDSEDSFSALVKGKKDAERAKGVNEYMKANKSKDVVWTVAQVSSLARKVIGDIVETSADFARHLAGITDIASQVSAFDEFFSRYGTTYKELTDAFKVEGVKTEASDAIIKAIEKIKDLAILEKIAAMLSVHMEVARLNATKLEAVLPVEPSDEGQFDDVIQFPIAA